MKKVNETGIILNFSDFIKYSDTLCETGTGRLHSVFAAISAGFKRITTVEACEAYHRDNINDLSEKFKYAFSGSLPNDVHFYNDNNETIVDLYFGMSQDRIFEMIKDVDRPIVFWVDAHPSGPLSAGHDDLMKNGNDSQYAQDNVITAELKIILAHRKDHIILIDDQNGVNEENEKYMAMILEANPNYKFLFYDEKRGNDYYKNKCLACIPE